MASGCIDVALKPANTRDLCRAREIRTLDRHETLEHVARLVPPARHLRNVRWHPMSWEVLQHDNSLVIRAILVTAHRFTCKPHCRTEYGDLRYPFQTAATGVAKAWVSGIHGAIVGSDPSRATFMQGRYSSTATCANTVRYPNWTAFLCEHCTPDAYRQEMVQCLSSIRADRYPFIQQRSTYSLPILTTTSRPA